MERRSLLGILLGVLPKVLFSSVIEVGTLGFPSDAFGCIGVPAGARLCKYWREDHLQCWIHTGMHSGAEAECRLVAMGVHSAQPRRAEAAAWPLSIDQRPTLSDHRTAGPVVVVEHCSPARASSSGSQEPPTRGSRCRPSCPCFRNRTPSMPDGPESEGYSVAASRRCLEGQGDMNSPSSPSTSSSRSARSRVLCFSLTSASAQGCWPVLRASPGWPS